MHRFIFFFLFLSMAATETLKTPEYILIKKNGKIEIREYSEYVIAKTSVENADLNIDGNMFRVLANYIFGGNERSQSIPMTAPVITKKENSSYDMIFFMLDAKNSEELPIPNSSKISIEKMKIGKTVSITFGMWATDKRVDYYKDKLDKYVVNNNLEINSPMMIAQYNSPWAVPPFRKNELIYRIK